ncbi:zinc metallopeptidase [Deferrisoma camini]|uniref:zinc metallopeptidase n=1 Tax=Deferrisoma camini TaxID=1035120 RepID=UPI00046D73EA|nr:zinc metallopeptidase [Deferrisoma camini]
MFYFDPLYFILIAPAFLLSLAAQMWVQSAFRKYGERMNRRGITGARAAELILARAGLDDVRIETAQGFLSDHYDPRSRVLRLSPDVYSTPSLAAVGVAAHEAGHALQHAAGYAPLSLRTALVPAASVGSQLAWPLLVFGFLLQATALVKLGVVFFAAAVVFQLVTLPVEFNASRRALAAVESVGILGPDEMPGARQVLTAAALTYVAAAVTSVMQLLYFLLRSGMLGGSDE